MSVVGLIHEPNLADFWRVDPHTLIKWRNNGRLDSDVKEDAENGYHHYYYSRTIDAFHREHSTGFSDNQPVPSLSQLLQAEPALLTTREAAAQLGCSADNLLASIRRGEIPAIHLGEHSVRLPATLIGLRASSVQGAVEVETAARVLCVKPGTVRALMATERLKSVTLIGKGRQRYVERDSLLELLATLIPSFIPPGVWWNKTLGTDGEALSVQQLAARHHMHRRTLIGLIETESRSLPYIRTTGDKPHRIVPAWGVQTFLREERERLMPQELAAILGVSPEQTEHWRRTRALCRRHHASAQHRCPTLSCLREYVAGHSVREGLDVDDWLTSTLRFGAAAVSSKELITLMPGLTLEDIKRALTEGMLTNGIWLPPQNGSTHVALPRSEAMRFGHSHV